MSNAAEFSTCSCPSLTLDYKNLMGASIILNNLSLISSLYIKHIMAQTIFEVLLPLFIYFHSLLYPSFASSAFIFLHTNILSSSFYITNVNVMIMDCLLHHATVVFVNIINSCHQLVYTPCSVVLITALYR